MIRSQHYPARPTATTVSTVGPGLTMGSNFTRSHIHRWLTTICILSLGLGAYAGEPTAEGQTTNSEASQSTRELAWVELGPNAPEPQVRIWCVGKRGSVTYVITHGMGGTASGDRFHELAAIIHKEFPEACVLRIDWSALASAKIGGFPNPWKVAARIDHVGDCAARVLKSQEIDPARITFIGESFGNWVNARIAHQVGGVRGILAVNPANEAGGYRLPDLRKHAQRSWSLHTYSAFDTTLEIAESDFYLQTPAGASHWEQHVAGIAWLSARLEADDPSWLHMDKALPPRRAGHFRASATMDGMLSDEQPPRERPLPSDATKSSADLLALECGCPLRQ